MEQTRPGPVIRIIVRSEGGELKSGGAELLDTPGVKWIDVQDADEPTMRLLAERYKLHRLAIEDCLHLDQRPKLEEYPEHQFIVLQSFHGEPARPELDEMHFLLGHDWVISVHENASAATAVARKRILEEPAGTIGRGPDFLVYLLADALMDQNFPLLDAFNDAVEDLEARIFEAPAQEHLQRAFELRRALVLVRRVLSPQRDVVGLLARRGIPNVQERTALYFRDVYDHLVRIYEQIESARDLLGNAMEGYLSVVANRTNQITKQLTIFATIFLPLSFITGFFGQNFDVLQSWGFFALMLTLVVFLPAGMVFWFYRRGWL